MVLQLRHATFITQSLKEIHSGRETGVIDTGPLAGEKSPGIRVKTCQGDAIINGNIIGVIALFRSLFYSVEN